MYTIYIASFQSCFLMGRLKLTGPFIRLASVLFPCGQTAAIVGKHYKVSQRIFIFMLRIRFINFIHKFYEPAVIIRFITKEP